MVWISSVYSVELHGYPGIADWYEYPWTVERYGDYGVVYISPVCKLVWISWYYGVVWISLSVNRYGYPETVGRYG
jgi:hypothetical protein